MNPATRRAVCEKKFRQVTRCARIYNWQIFFWTEPIIVGYNLINLHAGRLNQVPPSRRLLIKHTRLCVRKDAVEATGLSFRRSIARARLHASPVELARLLMFLLLDGRRQTDEELHLVAGQCRVDERSRQVPG
jgi:hypothetical protein